MDQVITRTLRAYAGTALQLPPELPLVSEMLA
jgi:hypothetical protein